MPSIMLLETTSAVRSTSNTAAALESSTTTLAYLFIVLFIAAAAAVFASAPSPAFQLRFCLWMQAPQLRANDDGRTMAGKQSFGLDLCCPILRSWQRWRRDNLNLS